MIIHTYHEPLPGFDRGEILQLWAESWRQHGWIPVVHRLPEALAHPRSAVFCAVASELPTVNPPGYELACWRRWLVAAQTGGFWCDDDLVNCGFAPPPEFKEFKYGLRFTAWHEHDVPNTGLMWGLPMTFEDFFVQRVLGGEVPLTKVNGRPHTSDMHLWQQMHREGKFRSVRGVADGYGKPGNWKLVHCSHHHAGEAGLSQVEAMRRLVNGQPKACISSNAG